MPGKIFNYLRNHKVIVIGVLLVLGVIGYYSYKKSHTVQTVSYITGQAEKQTITTSVSGTGQILASNQIDLKPQSAGAITSVQVQQGQAVKTGQTIATLDQKTASNQILSAKASLAQAEANYQKVVEGATNSDIALAKLAVDSAQQSLDNAQKNLSTVTQQQQQAVDNAYSNLLNSNLSLDPSDTQTTATITLSGNYTGHDQGSYKVSTYMSNGGLVYTVTGLGGESGQVQRGLPLPIGNGLNVTFGATGNISTTTIWTINVPNYNGSGYLSNLNAYNTAQQNQKSALNTAQNSIQTAQNQLDQAKIQYDQKTAPAANSDIAAAAAQVASAKASLASAQTAYSNNIISSPIDGVVATLNAKTGDQASSATALATIVTKQQIAQISLNEVDVAKIKLGEKANLTFDAVDGLNMTGEVAEIDTIGTATQGVVNYNVKITLDSQDDRIKPGMSVSVDIITGVKTDALSVPNSAVKTSADGSSYVQIMDTNGKPKDQTVTTGLSNDTVTEIVSGLNEGDKIITQVINSSSVPSSSSASRSSSGSNSTFRVPGLTGGGGGGVRIQN